MVSAAKAGFRIAGYPGSILALSPALVLLAFLLVPASLATALAGSPGPGEAGASTLTTRLIRVALGNTLSASPQLDLKQVTLLGPEGIRLSAVDRPEGHPPTWVRAQIPPQTPVSFTAGARGTLEIRWAEAPFLGDEAQDSSGSSPGPDDRRQRHLTVTGPAYATSLQPGGLLGVPSLDRPVDGPYPLYRGSLEVRLSPQPGQLRLINEVSLEDYLKGVVPSEMPASFELEALKAQAVAARCYALANLGKHGADGADLCDSNHCQVYLGASGEAPQASRAVDETAGLVATYQQQIIRAVYSSTAGGYTENNENVWGSWGDGGPAGDAIPYLRGVPDDAFVRPLDHETPARAFLRSDVGSFDAGSPYFRWTFQWTRQQLESILNAQLAACSAADREAVTPAFPPDATVGTLLSLRVLRRGVSGKALALEIQGTHGTWVVRKELNIRRVLKPVDRPLAPSANFFIQEDFDANGELAQITLYGTGFGHGVGMSQYGANGMARAGFNFQQILQHYYTGAVVSTPPVFLQAFGWPAPQPAGASAWAWAPGKGLGGRDHSLPLQQNRAAPASFGIHQDFYWPGGQAWLVVNNFFLSSIRLVLNGQPLTVGSQLLRDGVSRVDIRSYLNPGQLNRVDFDPPGQTWGAARVSIELNTPDPPSGRT